MRILVTGGTGFIGSHSVAALLRDGHSLRLLARTPSKVETALAPLGISRDRVEIVQSDIMDSEGVGTALDGCDAVYHCAGGVGIEWAHNITARPNRLRLRSSNSRSALWYGR